jgi:ribosomal-protein-alanine N-acetyltransferase
MYDIYEECPVFKNDLITLRKTSKEDAKELLKCYSDQASVPLFNSDNCHGDDFYYTTIERMSKAIYFWDMSYNARYFVRMTIIYNDTNEKIGTIEMFNRGRIENFGFHGILRIDLQSQYEKKDIILAILHLANQFFYEAFSVDCIITKAIPSADERIDALMSEKYHKIEEFPIEHYYVGYK